MIAAGDPASGYAATASKSASRSARTGPVTRLGDLSYEEGHLSYELHRTTEPESVLQDYLKYARYIFEEAELGDGEEPGPLALSDDFEHLRWFPLPSEIHATRRSSGPPT